MDPKKKRRLEAAGWRVGSAEEFLGLSPADATYVEIKLALAKALATRRAKTRYTQVEVARLLKSSQSRVAKMEAGDPSVSADLLIRSLLTLGASARDVGRALSRAQSSRKRPAAQH